MQTSVAVAVDRLQAQTTSSGARSRSRGKHVAARGLEQLPLGHLERREGLAAAAAAARRV